MLMVSDTLNEQADNVAIDAALGPFKSLCWLDSNDVGISHKYQLSCCLGDGDVVCVGNTELWWTGDIRQSESPLNTYTSFSGKGALFFANSDKHILLEKGDDWRDDLCIQRDSFLAATISKSTSVRDYESMALPDAHCLLLSDMSQVALLSPIRRTHVVTVDLDGDDEDCIVLNPKQLIGWSSTLTLERISYRAIPLLKFQGRGKIKASPCL